MSEPSRQPADASTPATPAIPPIPAPPGLVNGAGATGGANGSAPAPAPPATVDLARRRDELAARVAELQWDLGGLVYEMAVRNHIRVDVLVRKAAILQEADSELNEVERILRMEQTATAGVCAACGAPHSSGAAYCWQCGQPLLEHVPSHAIGS